MKRGCTTPYFYYLAARFVNNTTPIICNFCAKMLKCHQDTVDTRVAHLTRTNALKKLLNKLANSFNNVQFSGNANVVKRQ
jgi:inhibitor of KinA sporulation pathway (predicted exonuclease)